MAKEKVKTGFEGTGEDDAFGIIESEEDINLVDEEEKEKEEEVKKEEEKPEKELTKKEVDEMNKLVAEQGKELGEENDKEIDIFDEAETEKKEEKKEVPEEEEKELFDTTELEENLKAENELKEKVEGINWKDVIKGVEVPGVKLELKENSVAGFKEAVKEAIEKAKTVTEVDLSKYNAEQKEVISFFENGGTMAELMEPLKEVNDFLLKNDEEKVKDYLINVEKLSPNEAQHKVDSMIDDDTILEEVEKIDKKLHTVRQQRYDAVVKRSNELKEERDKTVLKNIEKENSEMKKVVDETKSFMGYDLPDNVKNYIKKEIDTGKLRDNNNNAQTQVFARLFSLYGEKLLGKIMDEAKDASNTSYNAGLKKEKEKVHNIPKKPGSIEATEQKRIDIDTHPLAAFANIDEDAIEGVD